MRLLGAGGRTTKGWLLSELEMTVAAGAGFAARRNAAVSSKIFEISRSFASTMDDAISRKLRSARRHRWRMSGCPRPL